MKKSGLATSALVFGLAFSAAGCAEGVGATQPPEISQGSASPNVQKSAGACAITAAEMTNNGIWVTVQLSDPTQKRMSAIFFTSTRKPERTNDPASPIPIQGPVGFPATISESGKVTATNTDRHDYLGEMNEEPFDISVSTVDGVKDVCGAVVAHVDGGVRIIEGSR